ncbi:hypothetical protein MJO28_016638 [Puccinia striiformis f. sp. tritici]|uniref:Uncharacterized protein n=1 Tax=Puccinia striiformis f. sp. tritici TaxID=168172 RepID=A0ACC0DNN9_9BASI|nr:hypothetical protein MJO28_016638 [Puccinia striiformis f. sp. tritici]
MDDSQDEEAINPDEYAAIWGPLESQMQVVAQDLDRQFASLAVTNGRIRQIEPNMDVICPVPVSHR